MWNTFRSFKPKAGLGNNASLRSLARKSSSHLFDDIGLNREDFLDMPEEQIRTRYWWYR